MPARKPAGVDVFGQQAQDDDALTLRELDAAVYSGDPLPEGKKLNIGSKSRDLALLPGGEMLLHDVYRLRRIGLQVADEARMTADNYRALGETLLALESGIQWVLGDYFLLGERRWRYDIVEMVQASGRAAETLYNYTYVCRHVDFSRRREKLTFGHHDAIAGLAPDDQVMWLDWAEAANEGKPATVAELRKALADWRKSKKGSAQAEYEPIVTGDVQRWYKTLKGVTDAVENYDTDTRRRIADEADKLAAWAADVALRARLSLR